MAPMSTQLQAVMDVVCQDNQALKELQGKMGNQESQALPVLQETQASHQQPHVNQPLLLHASHVHKDHQDPPAHPDPQATPVKLEPQDAQELMPPPEVLDLEVPLDHQENQGQSDPTENQVSQLNLNLLFRENPENQATKDHQDPQAHPEAQETMDHQDQLDRRENQGKTDPRDKMDRLDHQDHLEALDPLEKRVSARNTAPWTEVFSSRTVRAVKFEFDKIFYDSQASHLPLQRNAVFFLIQFPFIPSIVYANLAKARER